jgi:hypothetical protein
VVSDGEKRTFGKPFTKGVSGNPGGRPKIENDLAAVGAADPNLPSSTEEARRRWWAMILPVAFAGPSGNPKGDADWRYAAQEVGNRLLGKPKEHVEVSGSITPAESALLAAIRMTPDERMRRLRELDAEDQAALEAGPPADDDAG